MQPVFVFDQSYREVTLNLKTSNYGAARSILGLAEILWWCGFGLGIILALAGGGAGASGFGGGAGILGAVPGIIISIFCFFGVVHVQQTKASVDSADYAYQALAIAREQLAISKQALKQDAQALSFADRAQTDGTTSTASTTAETSWRSSRREEPTLPGGAIALEDWDYRDTRIHRTEHGFLVEGQTFQSLGDAKRYVDGSRPASRQSEPVTIAQTSPKQHEYRGVIIQRAAEGFAVQGQVFETLELAKNFVDGEALRASLASPT